MKNLCEMHVLKPDEDNSECSYGEDICSIFLTPQIQALTQLIWWIKTMYFVPFLVANPDEKKMFF